MSDNTPLELAVIGLAEAADKFARGPKAETTEARNNLFSAARHYSQISRLREQTDSPASGLILRRHGEVRIFRKSLSGELFELRWDGVRGVWTRDCQPGATWYDEELQVIGLVAREDPALTAA